MEGVSGLLGSVSFTWAELINPLGSNRASGCEARADKCASACRFWRRDVRGSVASVQRRVKRSVVVRSDPPKWKAAVKRAFPG